MGQIIDGKALAAKIREEVRGEVEKLKSSGIVPGLAAVLVGDNPASKVYVRNKRKACEEAGIYSEERLLAATATEEELLALIRELNGSPRIHGILVQLPLPSQVSSEKVMEAISPLKDVDGLHPENMGRLTIGRPRVAPCTPLGVMRMLEAAGIRPEGKRVVIVGRSNLVGRPLALLMMHANATVTVCHSKTADLPAVCREADILVAAIGRAGFVRADMVREGAVVIDVGINRGVDGKLVGDVDFAGVSPKASWITPVPGGVGPMTIAMLLFNTVELARLGRGKG